MVPSSSSSCSTGRRWSQTFDASLDEASRSDVCTDRVSCEFVQGAAEVTLRRYVLVTRLMRWYPEALELAEKINDEVAASDSAAGKSRLEIKHLHGALSLKSEKQDALLSIKSAAAYTRTSTTDKRTIALFKPLGF